MNTAAASNLREENWNRLDVRTATRTIKMVPGDKQDQKGQRPPIHHARRATFGISRLHLSECV